MEHNDSLLFSLFDYLRRNDVPLGVSEYQLAIKTFREGVGLEDIGSFRRLCRLLWAKSREDQKLFDDFFETWVTPQLQTVFESGSLETPPDDKSSDHAPPAPESHPIEYKPESKSGRAKEVTPQKRQEQKTFRPVSINLPSYGKSYQRKPYHFTPRLPLGRREMTGLWRHLRRPRREGPAEELDVEGTINTICQNGFFLSPTLRPRRRNQAKLVLLIDRQGSMAPFSTLIGALVESIELGGLLRQISQYYFHDCPEGVLYERSNLTDALPIEEVLSDQAKNNSVLIVSDAGAARGYYDKQRLEATGTFLKILNQYTYLYAWLNPMPDNRWLATTAEDIACLAPMFHLDREGLNDAINILRGHPFPPEVNLDAQH